MKPKPLTLLLQSLFILLSSNLKSIHANERKPSATLPDHIIPSGSNKSRRLADFTCVLLIKITHYETHETTTLDCQPIVPMDGETSIGSKPLTLKNVPEWLSEKLDRDEIHSNSDTLQMSEAIVSEEGSIEIPSGAQASIISMEDNESRQRRRHLTTTGSKSVLALLIKTNNLNAPTYTRKELRDEIFGTDGDVYNLKTGYSACSYDKLQFYPSTTGTGVFEGVMTVDLGTVNNESSNIWQAALSANGWAFFIQPPHDYVSALVFLFIFLITFNWKWDFGKKLD
jgi:hypothetical protein